MLPGSIKSSLVLICLCIFSLQGCGSEQLPFFPTSDGSWQYKITITTMDGSHREKYFVHTLPPVTEGEGLLYPRRTADGTTLLYTETDKGIFRLQSGPNSTLAPLLQYPLAAGTQWQNTSTTFLLEKSGPPQDTLFKIQEPVLLNYKITATDETVKVSAGNYKNCLKIEATGSTYANVGNYVGKIRITVKQTYWYAPNVGLIKSTRLEKTNSPALHTGSYIMELEISSFG